MGFNYKKRIKKNNKIGFLMMTYDGASFLWDDHFRLVKKYWSNFDSFFDGYIMMSETKNFKYNHRLTINCLNCSKKLTFCERLALAIQKLNTEYVFLIMDDFYLKDYVDLQRFKECILFLKENNGDYIEFENYRNNVTNKEYYLNYIKKLQKKMFLVTLQIGVWNANSLLKIIRLKETAWQFEYYGSIRACLRRFKGYTLKTNTNPIFNYDFGWLVTRGKFDKKIFMYFVENEGVDFGLSSIIGFKEENINTKKTFWVIFKNLLNAFLSIFKR